MYVDVKWQYISQWKLYYNTVDDPKKNMTFITQFKPEKMKKTVLQPHLN